MISSTVRETDKCTSKTTIMNRRIFLENSTEIRNQRYSSAAISSGDFQSNFFQNFRKVSLFYFRTLRGKPCGRCSHNWFIRVQRNILGENYKPIIAFWLWANYFRTLRKKLFATRGTFWAIKFFFETFTADAARIGKVYILRWRFFLNSDLE